MKITTTITKFVLTHEIIEKESEPDVLITHARTIGPVIISEDGAEMRVTEENGLYDLVERLQRATHDYISTRLKN